MVALIENRSYEPITNGSQFFLANNSVLSVNRTGDKEIACLAGSIWITQQDDNSDHVLSRGDRFVSRPKGLIVIWALTDAQIIIQSICYR